MKAEAMNMDAPALAAGGRPWRRCGDDAVGAVLQLWSCAVAALVGFEAQSPSIPRAVEEADAGAGPHRTGMREEAACGSTLAFQAFRGLVEAEPEPPPEEEKL